MSPSELLLSDIRQQAADLTQTIRLYESHYGNLPTDHLSATLLSQIIIHLPEPDLPPSPTTLYPIPSTLYPIPSTLPPHPSTLLEPFLDSIQLHPTTAAHYRNAYNALKRYLDQQPQGPHDIALTELTPELIRAFEHHLLHERKVIRNTSSFYMRQLRAIYNRAVRQGLIPDLKPFATVYTGIDRTRHRALTLTDLRRLKAIDLTRDPKLSTARDLFLFSYYTRGMSYIDMRNLTPTNLTHGLLTYSRSKTHQTLTIRWEPEMQHLLDRLNPSSATTPYLLPVLHPSTLSTLPSTLYPIPSTLPSTLSTLPSSPSTLPSTLSTLPSTLTYRQLNARLHRLGQLLDLPIPLTTYVARHTWASIAQEQGTPISIISQGLGHSPRSDRTTRIYLADHSQSLLDQANRTLIRSLK